MTDLRDRDPDRVPAAPLGYLRSQASVRLGLGSCDRCGATVEVSNPQAKELHERFHAVLRVMWIAQNGDGGGDAQDRSTTQ